MERDDMRNMSDKFTRFHKLISDNQADELLESFRSLETGGNSPRQRGTQDSSDLSQNIAEEQLPDFSKKEMAETDAFKRERTEEKCKPDYPSEFEPSPASPPVRRRFNQRTDSYSRQPDNHVNYNHYNSPENLPVRKQRRITDAVIVEDNPLSDEPGIATETAAKGSQHIPIKIAALLLSLVLLAGLLSSGSIMNLTEVTLSSNDRDSFFRSSSNLLLSDAMGEVHKIPRVYTLGMGEYLTPEPDQSKFTKIEDEERKNYDGTPIDYYKDETIEVKCWKEKTKYGIITFAEVWIAHPSQFRRALVDNVISKNHLDHPQNIFSKTNGVLGMSGDYCAYRPYGIEILYGNLIRDNVGKHLTPKMDILVYDTDGNFSVYESKKDFFETDVYKENKIIHTLAFGPMLIDDYKVSSQKDKLYKYQNGRPWEVWPRAAICQFDYEKHYLLCRLGQPGATMENFAKEINKKGVRLAYALDGGQTGTIMFNKKIVNEPAFDGTRAISDIIYFATAVPEE